MKIEDVFVDFGAFPVSRDAGDCEGISSVPAALRRESPGRAAAVAGLVVGGGCEASPCKFPCGS